MIFRFFTTIIWRVVALVGASTLFTAILVWLGTREGVSPAYTVPLAVTASVLIAWATASTTVEPLRQMRTAARAMASGDYSVRVSPQSQDEVGALAEAFNSMASDLAHVDAIQREVIANVSHELRTPVTALRGRLENMADGIEPATPENLESAVTQVERLTDLLSYLLDLSRLESGVQGLDVERIRVSELLDDAVEQVRLASRGRGKDVSFVTRTAPADLHMEGDHTRLTQVLVNVLDNAAKHSPDASVVLVEATLVRSTVRIDITDPGPGIQPEDRERIFGRFQRGGEASGGSGIGLAIARWAVTLHGGTIHVVDSPEGATFRISLPVSPPPETGDQSPT